MIYKCVFLGVFLGVATGKNKWYTFSVGISLAKRVGFPTLSFVNGFSHLIRAEE
jgi:hypothetical protein